MKTAYRDPSGLAFSIIKTSETTTRAGFTFVGGGFRKRVTICYAAILVRHPKGTFLFDTGLGNAIDAQYRADMPKWKQFLLHYGPVTSAQKQLAAHGYTTIPRIFLSHAHWDHASGVVDFPGTEIWVTAEEKSFLDKILTSPKRLFGPAVLRSQISAKNIRWHVYHLAPTPFLGFSHSYDIFGDSSAVIVPLPGHTPGSIGLILTLASKRRIFFCSDTVWNDGALDHARSKPWLARFITDQDQAVLHHTIQQVVALKTEHPETLIIPAHDGRVQDQFGYFPTFYDGS